MLAQHDVDAVVLEREDCPDATGVGQLGTIWSSICDYVNRLGLRVEHYTEIQAINLPKTPWRPPVSSCDLAGWPCD